MTQFTTENIIIALALLLIIILGLMFITKEKAKPPVVKEFYILGTIIQLKVFGNSAGKAIDEAVEKLNDIDEKMSVFKNFSEISTINKNAGGMPQIVSRETYFVIKKAIQYCKLSNGAFDPTIKPVIDLWGINTDNARIPDMNEIKDKLKLVNYNDIILNEKDSSIKLSRKNQALDAGGIAKGYAADEVKDIFVKNHIKSAIIDLGGNILVLGKKSDGNYFNVGIQDPLKPRGEYVGIVRVMNKSVVTSGNYERYFKKEGKMFHHIIDPLTGFPSESEIISATIISDYSIDGDGLSTGVYIMGIDLSTKLIEGIKGIDAIFITKDKKIYATSGIRNNFELLNSDFIYQYNYPLE